MDRADPPLLVVVGGRPGTGKTTLARLLARRLQAAHLRIDTVEQTVLRSSLGVDAPAETGYTVAAAVAVDNLRLDLDVVVDAVSGVEVAREGWRRAARDGRAVLVELLLVCDDPDEHRRRVEGRVADIAGHRQPTWVEASGSGFADWPQAATIETAHRTPDEVVEAALDVIDDARRDV